MIENIKKLASFGVAIAVIFSGFKIYYGMDQDIDDLQDNQKKISKNITDISPSLLSKFQKARCKDALTLLNLSLTYPKFIPMEQRDEAISKMFQAGHGAQLKDLKLTCNSCNREILIKFISEKAAAHHCPRFGISYAKNKTTQDQEEILNKLNKELQEPL